MHVGDKVGHRLFVGRRGVRDETERLFDGERVGIDRRVAQRQRVLVRRLAYQGSYNEANSLDPQSADEDESTISDGNGGQGVSVGQGSFASVNGVLARGNGTGGLGVGALSGLQAVFAVVLDSLAGNGINANGESFLVADNAIVKDDPTGGIYSGGNSYCSARNSEVRNNNGTDSRVPAPPNEVDFGFKPSGTPGSTSPAPSQAATTS